jgi:hypothetical protein
LTVTVRLVGPVLATLVALAVTVVVVDTGGVVTVTCTEPEELEKLPDAV